MILKDSYGHQPGNRTESIRCGGENSQRQKRFSNPHCRGFPTAWKNDLRVSEKSGYTNLIMTMNGQEAWDKLTEFKKKGTVRQDVHCIITDIEMPLMDGHRLTKLCKSDDEIKKIPLIIFHLL